MNWLAGVGGHNLALHFRELEHYVRAWGRVVRREPDRELPDVELSEHDRRAALERETSRRAWGR